MAGLLEDGTATPDTGGLFGLPANFDIGDALGHLYSRVKGALTPEASPLWPLDSPVGTERVGGDTSVGMPDPNVSLQLDRGWGGDRNPTAAEAEAMARGTQTAFGTMAAGAGGDAAEMPSSGPVALASRRVRAPGAGPRPPEPSAPPDAGLLGIRAFHGSPYDFNAFDTSKIGTGEGAQAYGHGLYFAENEGVAQSYRDNLGEWKNLQEYRTQNPTDRVGHAAEMLAAGSPPGLVSDALKVLEPNSTTAMRDEWVQQGQALRDQMNGRMYEVSLNADPEHFLDWDKPAAMDHPVRDLLFNTSDPHVNSVYGNLRAAGKTARMAARDEQLTGTDAYHYLAKLTGGSEQAAAALRDAGIPGIRYLDQGSRAQGKGTSNFVVFDPATIEILRKYGIAGLMAGGGAAAATQRQDQ
jgi:hypothetical protein